MICFGPLTPFDSPDNIIFRWFLSETALMVLEKVSSWMDNDVLCYGYILFLELLETFSEDNVSYRHVKQTSVLEKGTQSSLHFVSSSD